MTSEIRSSGVSSSYYPTTSAALPSGKLANKRCLWLRNLANALCGHSKKNEVSEENSHTANMDSYDEVAAKIASNITESITPHVDNLIDRSTQTLGDYLKGQCNNHIPIVGPSLAPGIDVSMSGVNTLAKRGAKMSINKSTTATTQASANGVKDVVKRSTSSTGGLWNNLFGS